MKNIRKFISAILIILCVSACDINVLAMSAETSAVKYLPQIEYQSDGSYYITEIHLINDFFRSGKKGQKSTSYYTPSGSLAWKLTVTGTFSYNGSSSSCSNATSSLSSVSSSWSTVSKSAYPSGNTAVGTATMRQNGGGNISKSVQLKCSASGILS